MSGSCGHLRSPPSRSSADQPVVLTAHRLQDRDVGRGPRGRTLYANIRSEYESDRGACTVPELLHVMQRSRLSVAVKVGEFCNCDIAHRAPIWLLVCLADKEELCCAIIKLAYAS